MVEGGQSSLICKNIQPLYLLEMTTRLVPSHIRLYACLAPTVPLIPNLESLDVVRVTLFLYIK